MAAHLGVSVDQVEHSKAFADLFSKVVDEHLIPMGTVARAELVGTPAHAGRVLFVGEMPDGVAELLNDLPVSVMGSALFSLDDQARLTKAVAIVVRSAVPHRQGATIVGTPTGVQIRLGLHDVKQDFTNLKTRLRTTVHELQTPGATIDIEARPPANMPQRRRRQP